MATTKKAVVKSTKRPTKSKKAHPRVGTSKLAPRSGFKLWMAALVVVLVATAGYVVVNFSEAGTAKTFHYSGDRIKGGTTKYVNKNNGQQQKYKAVDAGGVVHVSVSAAKLNKTKKACVYFVKTTANQTVSAQVWISVGGFYSNGMTVGGQPGSGRYICTQTLPGNFTSAQRVNVTVLDGSIFVRNIYGNPR